MPSVAVSSRRVASADQEPRRLFLEIDAMQVCRPTRLKIPGKRFVDFQVLTRGGRRAVCCLFHLRLSGR
jgi:hypothetical protein